MRQPCDCPRQRQWWPRLDGGHGADRRQEQPSSKPGKRLICREVSPFNVVSDGLKAQSQPQGPRQDFLSGLGAGPLPWSGVSMQYLK